MDYEAYEQDGYWFVDIPFEYRNREVDTVYVAIACHGEMHAALEKLEDGRWTKAWPGYDHGCPSRVLVAPGQTYASQLQVTDSEPLNSWKVDSIPGIYRIVVRGISPTKPVTSIWHDTIAKSARWSNSFRLY
jgi:hypothetical protein